ncbi:hypothetical protein VB005_06685 [Metarhizium brunneum]
MLAATEDTCDRLNQYLHKTGTPEEQIAKGFMSLEEVSAAASYIDENKFEHYGVDMDDFNIL